MKRDLRPLKGDDHGVRYNDFKYSLKDLIDDGGILLLFVRNWGYFIFQ
jgi:hypothetical protein